jgi:hypothetical protein
MVVIGSLTIHRVQRKTSPDGRCLPPIETTEYIQPDRKREEHRGYFGYRVRPNGRDIYRTSPRTALIKRCDLQKQFHVNFDDREYTAWPIQAFPTREETLARADAVRQPAGETPATVLVETETVDTGERREFFGRPARHVITTRRVIPLIEPTSRQNETVTDGWYIDLDTALSCDPWWWSKSGHAFATLHKPGDQPERPTFKDIGEPERGYAVVSRGNSGGSIVEFEVTHLSSAPIDPAVFDVPDGFSLVERICQEPVPPLVIRFEQAYQRLKRRARVIARRFHATDDTR